MAKRLFIGFVLSDREDGWCKALPLGMTHRVPSSGPQNTKIKQGDKR
jgi:hypothetical protein